MFRQSTSSTPPATPILDRLHAIATQLKPLLPEAVRLFENFAPAVAATVPGAAPYLALAKPWLDAINTHVNQ